MATIFEFSKSLSAVWPAGPVAEMVGPLPLLNLTDAEMLDRVTLLPDVMEPELRFRFPDAITM
ncbi:MAG: hypothetical protein WCV82_01730, partial [Candidatus Paceibacterota bacterium]